MNVQRRLLETVLAQDSLNYPKLYMTSAQFHASVDTMVRLIPMLTKMLADNAVEDAQRRALMAETLLRGPGWTLPETL